jgi:phospholipase C
MSEPSGPGSRVPIPRRQLRFDRRRAARRRGFAVFLGVVVVAIAALGWASTRGDEEAVSTGPSGGTSPATGSNGGTGASGSSGNGAGAIVPGETPIEHVVFVVKENRTFNNYFATYPGAEGATEGDTIKCS